MHQLSDQILVVFYMAGPLKKLERAPSSRESWDCYLAPLTRDATVLYLLAKHFPQQLALISPNALDNITGPIELSYFNTQSAAW